MNYGEGSGLSTSDVLALTNNRSSGSNDGGWGDNGAWWIILFLIFGWGRNGFGGGFGGGNSCGANTTCATPADVYNAVDQQTLISKLDQQTYGLADSTYALNNAINTGFFGVQNALCQGFNGLNVAYLQGTNSLASQLANCCCDIKAQIADCCCTTQRAIDGINYNMATNTCAITNAMNMNTRDIIDNQNANYRAIHEELIANKLEMKNDRIAELTAQVNKLQLAASQERQNNFFAANQDAQTAELIRRLGADCPSPAYIVPNPNCCYNYNVTGVGYGNGCNCGNY